MIKKRESDEEIMISIQEALAFIKKNLPPPHTVVIRLEKAFGQVLAEDITAPLPSPTYTNSAMDGFAVRWQDVSPATAGKIVTLQLIGESRAGLPFNSDVQPGTAVRINTGAMLPGGADTVIPVEDSAGETEEKVSILKAGREGQHVRHKGEEFRSGDRLLSSGRILQARQIALLASMGIPEVSVYQKPRIAILATGSELVAFDQPAANHQLRDSNGPMLESLARESGALPVRQNRVGDDLSKTEEAIAAAAEECDVIVISGGVSVGPHDHVKTAAARSGFEEIFWKVKQKPGKPLFFAKKKDVLLFGLPGNPVSAFMGFTHYIKPAIRALRGLAFEWPIRSAIATEDYTNNSNRDQLLRFGFLPGYDKEFKLLDQQGSHMLTSIALADGYVVVPAGISLTAGKETEIYLFGEV